MAARSQRLARLLRATQVDGRLLGMLGALFGTFVVLDSLTDGIFLSPRNLFNLAVQSSAVGIMATGMVLVIVTRHIDLSVGSLLGFCGMAVAVLQAEVLPTDAVWAWPASLAACVGLGALLGAWNGYWVAFRGLPAFVVTLAGLLMFRGAAWLLTDGRTVAPLLEAHQWLGGGLSGSIGEAASRALGVGAIVAVTGFALRARAKRRAVDIAVKPLAAEVALLALWAAGISAFVFVMNAHTRPGSDIGRGIPVPVLILIAVAIAMNALARSTRFGRHVFAMGGSPRAARLAGVSVRSVTLRVFMLMGALSALGAILTTARLDAGTNSMGTLAELHVIAAAVIGGTSLAGGAGSVGGAILGAVLMQSLENGMVLLDISSALRQVSIGLVLIAAIWIDSANRRGGEAS